MLTSKHLFGAAGILLAFSAITATAQAANNPPIVWQGSVTITSLSPACDSTGYNTDQLLTSVFRPRLQPDESPSGITMLSVRSAQAYFNGSTTNDQMNGSGSYAGARITGRAGVVPNKSQGFFTGTFKFKIKPALITATTTSITITGQLTNFADTAGCTMAFVGAYQPRGD